MHTLDDLDRRMIAALQTDARASVSALAQGLGIARTTAQARLERLERNGVVTGYTLRLNPEIMGAMIRATVLVQVEPRANAAVLARLKRMPAVELANTTSGRYDLALQLRAATTVELDETLDGIGAIEGVRSLESLIHLSTRIDRAL